MVFRGLSVQRFDLLTGDGGVEGGGLWLQIHCQVLIQRWPDCHIYMWALQGWISEVNIWGMAPDDVGVGWTAHSWVLALVNVERSECNVCFPLVLWFEVCIFPLLRRAVRCGCIMLQLLWWQPPDLLWTSTPLFTGYLLSFSSTWIHQIFA